MSARVAQGGVGKSSGLSAGSIRWAVTACDLYFISVLGLLAIEDLGSLMEFLLRGDPALAAEQVVEN